MTDTVYKAAIYCRLSKDDEQSGDSVSIETQKMMLTKFCMDQTIEIFDIYVDDGYSGLNFNRPSFKRLIQDLEDGKFNTVITKDLSRLGRDYIQTGYYIDIYFTSKRVRYIAVNDGIDTKHENNDIAPFKNILNDMYAKDLSRKVKSAKHQRAQNGLYISAQPPYGYKVNPYNRNQLIVDEEVAPVVKFIFKLAEEEKSFSEISRILEAEKYISPSTYKVMTGDTRFLKLAKSDTQVYKWPYQTVKMILTNPVYVGDMVNHKVEVANYKTKERIRVPKEEQIIVPNMHEAIIERNLFNRINAKLSKRRRPNHKHENVFKGLIFCAECGTEMQLLSIKRKHQAKAMFRCPQHAVNKKLCHHHHFIYYDELIKETKKQLEPLIAEFLNSDEYFTLCKSIAKYISSQVVKTRESDLQHELLAINKHIKEYYKNASKSDTSKCNSYELDKALAKQKELLYRIGNSSFEKLNLMFENEIVIKLQSDVKEYINKILLNENNFNMFIRKIEIGHLEKTSDGNRQKITLYYNF